MGEKINPTHACVAQCSTSDVCMDWLVVRVDPVTSTTHSSMTWFGELSRRHRFRQARNPSDYQELTVKDQAERLVPWTRGKPLAWDVAVPDTYAASHLQLTSTTACATAEKAALNKTTKYVALAATHSFVPSPSKQAVLGAHSRRNSSKTFEDESLRLPTSRSSQHTCTRGCQ